MEFEFQMLYIYVHYIEQYFQFPEYLNIAMKYVKEE